APTAAARVWQPKLTLKARLDEILHRRDDADGNVKFAARIIELDTGRELYANLPDEPFLPASNGKLPVSAAALDTFGASRTFDTHLALSGDDLWLIGTGDPAIGDPAIEKKRGRLPTSVLDDWATTLMKRGVTQIKGNLYFYDGALDDVRFNPTWSKGFHGDWYAAPVSGLNFNDDCIDVTIYPTTEGQPVAYTLMPPVKDVKIISHCLSAAGTEEPSISRDAESNTYTISGNCSKQTTLKSKSAIDPGPFFADALRMRLELRGITIGGETKRATRPAGASVIPAGAEIVATHKSTMPDVMWRINKSSQNMFADAMFKLMGNGTWEGGGDAVHAFLKKAGIDDAHYKAVDGSGLSRENRVTARLMTDLLAYMAKHPEADVFRESLSAAGVDGTIRNRMHDLKGRVQAKTGYIGGVRALSGYVQKSDDKWLAFSIIFNGFKGSERPFETLQDEAVHVLADLPNVRPSTQPTTRPTTRPRRAATSPS
ncbi:MAG: D-alanyl-D-alanine carboxypeptidase/D-alanyl-D-alanine-endopeptidase, partial [Planctomycetota bacterium]|nr:D-alanyl-D-alanine carboxypeptidase/D-alanyl-D-alanine-endopeptidase [Planctomycetota bacterium]